ncbi:MAG TPA: hydrogenase formation protein HypD, partial [Clostridia bacterium]
VGFETTTPVVALTVLNAVSQGITNFMILCANKTIPEAMRTLSSDKEIGVDGYIYPGHVSAVIGDGLYQELADKYGIPGVITGFEPVDILGAVLKLTELIKNGESRVLNLYGRAVNSEGNPIAVEKAYQVFEECDAIWRGLGLIPMSGLRLREKYESLDAWKLLGGNQEGLEEEPAGCRCGDILKGICIPCDCKLFKTACTPETPVGSCMVSSEGTCAAYYRYG